MTEAPVPNMLIVDDDYYTSTDVLAHHFRLQGFNVANAYTAAEFEERWQEANVIILDIRLPNRPCEPIDPWGGLRSLNRIRSGLAQGSAFRQLDNCIIRSAQTPEDAKAASISVPQHFKWFGPDVPFSRLLSTVRAVLTTS